MHVEKRNDFKRQLDNQLSVKNNMHRAEKDTDRLYYEFITNQYVQMKKREEMLKNIRRGDTIVTGGGIVAKVTKVLDNGELEVQISEQVRVRVLQGTVTDVRVKGEPAAANTK